jgi:light-regulated signal transduction histidine kinase (bacteriophytochrome)
MLPLFRLKIDGDEFPRNCRLRQATSWQQAEAVFLRQQLDNLTLKLTHDLRSPLQSVVGCADLILGKTAGPLNQKQKCYMRCARTSTGKILQILDSAPALRAQGTVVRTRV